MKLKFAPIAQASEMFEFNPKFMVRNLSLWEIPGSL